MLLYQEIKRQAGIYLLCQRIPSLTCLMFHLSPGWEIAAAATIRCTLNLEVGICYLESAMAA